MKLRSAQFVLLVLLLTSLRLSEGSALRMADELLVGPTRVRLSQTSETDARPTAAQARIATAARQPELPLAALRAAWTMRQPAAQAVAVQAVTTRA